MSSQHTPGNFDPSGSTEAERLHLFIAGITDYAIYMMSPEGRVASWNAGAQRFKGYAPDEIIGQHFSRFYTDADRAEGVPARALETARTTGKFEAEGWRVRKDGSRFWAHVVIDPIFGPDGKLAGFVKITRDVTDRWQAQQALRESEQRFRLLVQGVTDYAIYMLSPEGLITNWNVGAHRIKGFEVDEVVGTHFERFYTEEDRAQGMPRRALRVAAEEGRYEAEGWRVRKDGSRFFAHVVIDPIRDDHGKLIGFAKITRDITERRNAQLALEQAREALFQSQKLEALGKLTGGVAHDFNNLLNVITNGLAVVRQRSTDPALLRTLDMMEKATTRGGLLTQQLLSFARQQPVQPELRDVNRIISSFEAVLRRAGRHGIAFDLRLAPGLPPVLIDPTQFEAALLNLVVNARDAIAQAGRITLSTELATLAEGQAGRLPAGRYVEVTVQDSGAGMTPEVLSRAIEPFFTTKETGKGTGLGLSQVYGMTQQAGGEIGIRSEPGVGTAVTLYFPPGGEVAQDEPPQRAQGPEKVLVVDDQPDLLDTTADLFRSLGYDVLAANSGMEALDILRRTPDLELLFSDVVMPGLSGIELARQARDIVPGVKVILVSGYAAPALQAQDGSLGGFEFLPKPYRIADVIRKLRTAA